MKENNPGPFLKVNAKIEMVGDPQSLVGLLEKLESSLRILDVFEISITKETTVAIGIPVGTGPNYILEVKLFTYYAK
jgi:hypothetical protein